MLWAIPSQRLLVTASHLRQAAQTTHTADDINPASGNYGIFLIMGGAGLLSSTVP